MYVLYGAMGSPYSMKMRAVLRYWRAPFLMRSAMGGAGAIAHIRPPIIPVVHTPHDEWLVDSTPMIEHLDPILGQKRTVIPSNPVLEFLSYLFEDFADEWLTKVMFGYRWGNDLDARIFAVQGCYDILGTVGHKKLETYAKLFEQRQKDRMNMVGCTDQNMDLLAQTLDDLIVAMNEQIPEQRFLFGSRPSRADFALYGQLSQLCSDPTPSARICDMSPLFHRWVTQCGDLSAVEGEWREGSLSAAATMLLRLCVEIYVPFLIANEAAYQSRSELSVILRGTHFRQPSFKYQTKCLAELKKRYAQIGHSDQGLLTQQLIDSGLHKLLT